MRETGTEAGHEHGEQAAQMAAHRSAVNAQVGGTGRTRGPSGLTCTANHEQAIRNKGKPRKNCLRRDDPALDINRVDMQPDRAGKGDVAWLLTIPRALEIWSG